MIEGARPGFVEAANVFKAVIRTVRSGRPLDRIASFLAASSGLAFVVLEGFAVAAAIRVAAKALPALPALSPPYLVEKLLFGGFSAAAFLLLLGSLTTAVSTLFLSEELPTRMALPIPHRRLFARQLRITILSASA
ncbi:MAG TPA: hypothetical protein VGR00_06225, partial [Thermoanaerobaculia bacterium]|nr:hypothetical protein [Thermoanaerobaculia bacterium]